MQISGSKRLQGFCPGEMTVRQRHKSGLCLVTLQKVHVGHSIDDFSEVRHIRLTQIEKEWIASQLMEGVSKDKLEEKITLNFALHGTRLSTLTLKDIANVANAWKIKAPTKKNDPVEVEDFISQQSDSILFCKRQKEQDTKFNIFENDDFIIVYQTSFQKQILQEYGHKVVAFNETHDLSPYGFIVHTMLVVDAENEGFAVAFMVSNRSDEAAITVFIRCVQENAGTVNTTTLMTDVDGKYYNGWTAVMGEPKFSFFCMWYLKKEWRENLHKLITVVRTQGHYSHKSAEEERDRLIGDVEQQLFEVANELDDTIFTIKLNNFLSMNNPAVKPFLDYFQSNYVDKGTVEAWASCYRKQDKMNVDMHVETFNHTLKNMIAKKKKISTLAACLHYLELYIVRRTKWYLRKVYRPKVELKLQTLRQRHSVAEKFMETQSLTVLYDADYRVWQVGSFTTLEDGITEMYSVEKNEIMECTQSDQACTLRCSGCNTCLHEYRCSCHDSAGKHNMCEHIHALCLFLQNDISLREDSAISPLPVDEDPPVTLEVPGQPTQVLSIEIDKIHIEDIRRHVEETFDQLKSNVLQLITADNYHPWLTIEGELVSQIVPSFKKLINGDQTEYC